jgi:iron complex outermembrane receptor protein
MGRYHPIVAVALWALLAPFAAADDEPRDDIADLDLEALTQLEVTSVSKRSERVATAAAAVFVITHEDIQRSGVTTLVDALRLAPGVHVGRIDSDQWAVGIRGFTSRLARSVLVLIDGRSVYSPLFAGTYWEIQDYPLDDVERIEVIRGPGGSLWGVNAFNGVINIITRSAQSTRGGLASGGVGTEELRFATVRQGWSIGERGAWRFYAKAHERDPAFHPDGADYDDWGAVQAGFRLDLDLGPSEDLTVSSDVYAGDFGQRVGFAAYEPPFSRVEEREADISGVNLLGRWSRRLRGGSELHVQAYFDRTRRREVHFTEDRDTIDAEFQHHLPIVARIHDITWGVDARRSEGDTGGVPTVVFDPPERVDRLYGGFVHDAISFRDGDVRLIVGSKFGDNNYTGFEVQPNVRLAWSVASRHFLWAAASRAVRAPSRTEHDLSLTFSLDPTTPTFARIVGSTGFESEEIRAYEAGYRSYPSERVLLDVAAFYNRYDELLTIEPGAPFAEDGRTIVPYVIDNGLAGHGKGFEVATQLAIRRGWNVTAAYGWLDLDLAPEPGSGDTTSASQEDASPRHRVMLRSLVDLTPDWTFDAVARYVDELPGQQVPDYVSLDLRLAWTPHDDLELAIVGQNLLEARHPEFGSPPGRAEIERGAYLEATWRW